MSVTYTSSLQPLQPNIDSEVGFGCTCSRTTPRRSFCIPMSAKLEGHGGGLIPTPWTPEVGLALGDLV